MSNYRYRCTNKPNKKLKKKPCQQRYIFTQAKHDRAQAGEEFRCTCGSKITFTKADYASQRRQVCNCGGRPRAHRRGQRGCAHDTRGFATEDDYRDFINGMQAAFS